MSENERTKNSREFNGLIKHVRRKWRRIIEYMKEEGKAAKYISDRNACAQKISGWLAL